MTENPGAPVLELPAAAITGERSPIPATITLISGLPCMPTSVIAARPGILQHKREVLYAKNCKASHGRRRPERSAST